MPARRLLRQALKQSSIGSQPAGYDPRTATLFAFEAFVARTR